MIRQKFIDAFHDKLQMQINKIIPGKDVFFFNAYSYISISNKPLQFDINNADAARLMTSKMRDLSIQFNSVLPKTPDVCSDIVVCCGKKIIISSGTGLCICISCK